MDGIANPQCPKCRGFGECCNGPCDLRIPSAILPTVAHEDVLAVAQYAKTYADGPVWRAACRILAAKALAELEADDTDAPMVCTVCRQPVEPFSGAWCHLTDEAAERCEQIGRGDAPVKAMVAAGNENAPGSTP